MSETFTLWARTAQESHETMTTERFDFTGSRPRENGLAYMRLRGEWHVAHRGVVAFSIRDLSGMIVHEKWVLETHGACVPPERRLPPEQRVTELMRKMPPAFALNLAQSQDPKSPYWAKVREILETFAARAAKK